MPSSLPTFPLRIERVIIKKLKYIATGSGRSINKEIRNILLRYIEQYETKHGKIKIDP